MEILTIVIEYILIFIANLTKLNSLKVSQL